MSVQSEINRITNAVTDAYTAVEEMGGTIPSSAVIANLPTAINSIPPYTEIDTEAGMSAVLIEANAGKFYKYTGVTTSNYINGDLYKVVEA